MTDSDDEPPPLEDMEEELALLRKLRGIELNQNEAYALSSLSTESKPNPIAQTKRQHQSPKKPTSSVTVKSSSNTPSSSSRDGFAGFQKGFLSGNTAKNRPTPFPSHQGSSSKSERKETQIETLRPKASPKSVGVLPEVQQAMTDALPFLERTKDQWLNSELLKKFQKNPFLLECLADPSFTSALSEFEKNPAAAKQKYATNGKVLRFFREYFQVMGDHFTSLGEKETANSGKSSNASK